MAKRRTTTKRKTRRKKKSNPILVFDVLGVALIFLCPIMLIALVTGDSSGVLGRYIAASVRVAVGVGAFIIPFLLALLGTVFIVGPLKIIPRNIGIGSTMLFLVVITWASLTWSIHRPDGASAEPANHGGYIGDVLAFVLRKASGDVISYILLVAVAVIGVIILIDVPLANAVDKIRSLWADWAAAAGERVADARESRAKDRVPKVKEEKDEVAQETRKRTLERIFKRNDNGADQGEDRPDAEDLELVHPPVKVNGSDTRKPAPVLNTEGNGQKADVGDFQLPPTTLLAEPQPSPPRVESELEGNIETIERTLEEFKVTANVVEISHGPTVTRYEIQLGKGIKVNKIVGLADNLAMQLAAIDVRVEAPIPGKAAIGVEVPNKARATVGLREVVESKGFREAESKLTFALGKDVSGRAKSADLARMPHMLVGGATNAGKSICLNSLIASLLFRATPSELKFVLIDPKRVELSLFDGIPHLACPVVKDVKQASGILGAVVKEMENRYELFSRNGSRNIDGYNERVPEEDRMPYMVVVVDELADLMVQCAAEVEGSITRIAQLARATGIHLVIATQRPSVDVITGVIKANISSRIAFAVSSHHDSRTILDQKGAERLIGCGDMLFLPIDAAKPTRIQGSYISEREVEDLCKFLKDQRKPTYTMQASAPSSGGGGAGGDSLADELYEPSIRFVVNTGYCSTSMLQRKYKIGYTRAARIVDTMEEQGIVGPLDGAKPRKVLISKADLEAADGGPSGMPPDDDDDEFIEEAPPAEIIEPDDEEEQ